MKTVKPYILTLAAAAALSGAFTACQDDIDAPVITAPVATIEANTTIAELKAALWDDATNYAKAVEKKADGTDYIIKGRVISSDEQSNVFKFLTIQDETGAINFSINSYNLYLNYRFGQEVVINATGMYIGKYAGLQQFGTPTYYENGSTWQVGFMAPEFFSTHAQANGLPQPAAVDTLTVNSFSELDSSPEGLRRWQSQLVRFNNVHFMDGGVKTFSANHSNANDDVNRNIVDANGESYVVVRTSGYADFWNKTLPEGDGDIVGILSFYQNLAGASTWQLILNDYEGCMNFGNPTIAPGTETNPWQVADVIALEQNGTPASGWVSGYIVGAVAPAVTTVENAGEDIQWEAPFDMPYTLVIGESADTRDLGRVLVLELPAGTTLREFGNLKDNPGNLGKAITVKGSFEKVMGTYGITGNSGAASQFKIEGLQTGNEAIPTGNGSEASPYNPTQIIAFNPSSTTAAVESGVWTKGYIVGYMPTEPTTVLSGTVFGATGTVPNSNLVIAATPDETDYKKCVGIQLVTGTITPGLRDALNLADHPENIGKVLSIKGDIMMYCKGPGIKNGSAWTLDGQGSVTPPPGGDALYSETFTDGSLGAFTTTVTTSGTWTGWRANTSTVPCAIANSYVSGVNEAATAWLISPEINLSGATKASLSVEQAFGYYFPSSQDAHCTLNIREAGGEWQQLTLTVFPDAPTSSNWSSWAANTVDLSAYVGKTVQLGFKYDNDGSGSIAWEIRNFAITADGGSVDPGDDPNPPTPPTPSGEYKGDFDTFNGGAAAASPYGDYTNATGWKAEWSVVLGGSGGAGDNSPLFDFIGNKGTLAPTLNGNTAKVGKLTSPVLTGGCGTLTFKYGFAFSESKCSFTVNVKQGGNVVKTDTVTLTTLTTKTAYDYTLDVNVSGDFTIEIVNNCLSGATSNKDRLSIWNLTWTD